MQFYWDKEYADSCHLTVKNIDVFIVLPKICSPSNFFISDLLNINLIENLMRKIQIQLKCAVLQENSNVWSIGDRKRLRIL